MMFRRGVVTGVLVVAGAGALGFAAVTSGAGTLRIMLAVSALLLCVIGAVYALEGYAVQAVAHVVAGGGLAIAAAAGEGLSVWAGALLAAVGGALLIRDALRRGRRRRPAV